MHQTPYPFPRAVRMSAHEERRTSRFLVVCDQPGKGREMLAALFIGSGLELAAVHDLSADGVGLLVSRPFAPGVQAVGKIYSASRDFCCSRLLRATHVTERPGGSCLLGFRFDKPLRSEELQALLEVKVRVSS